MQPTKRDETAAALEARLRVMRIIWAVFFAAVWLYALIGYVAGPMSGAETGAAAGERISQGPPSFLLPLLVIIGVAAVLASIVVRRAHARRAEAERRPDVLQTGMVVAVALCEAAALCGLVGLFVTGDSYSYVLFVVSSAGLALHFPRRARLLAASPNRFGGFGLN